MQQTIAQEFSGNYPIEIREHNKIFYAFCNKFNLISEVGTIVEACNKLFESRKNTLNQLNSLGIDINTSSSNIDFKQILIYTALISSLMMPLAIISGGIYIMRKSSNIINILENKIKNTASHIVSDPRHVTENLNKVITTLENITPERKQEIQQMAKRLALFMQPIVAEVNEIDFSKNKSHK